MKMMDLKEVETAELSEQVRLCKLMDLGSQNFNGYQEKYQPSKKEYKKDDIKED